MNPTTCDAVRVEIPLIAGGTPPSEGARSHLEDCADCRRELVSAEQLVAMIGRAPLEHQPPEGLEERALARVGIQTHAQMGGWTRAATVLAPGLAAAAVVFGILAVGWHEDASNARNRVRSMTNGAGVPIHTVSLFDHNNHSRARVTLMSDNSSTQTSTSGYHLVVTVHDLPPTAPGYHYELWLIGPKGVVPSIAFPMGRSGSMAFNFPLDVDPHAYPSIEMTLEPDDGDPGMNGAPLMTGKLAANAP